MLNGDITNEEAIQYMIRHAPVNELARCRECNSPFYFIYQNGLRDFCHECTYINSLMDALDGKRKK